MKVKTIDDVIEQLMARKQFFHEKFGVTRMGVFGSFVRGTQTDTSDVDIVVEFAKERKNLHNFLALKRLLESELERSVDLGFEHVLKPTVREKIKGGITYV